MFLKSFLNSLFPQRFLWTLSRKITVFKCVHIEDIKKYNKNSSYTDTEWCVLFILRRAKKLDIGRFSSVQSLSHVQLFATPWITAACPSPTPRVYPNSCPSSWWCHPGISSSVIPSSSCPQSLPASETFPMSQFFASGGQSTGVSASASVLPMNIQDWFPLGLTGLSPCCPGDFQ